MAGKGDYAFPLRPSLVADQRIVCDVISQMRFFLPGNQANLQITNPHAAVGAVQVRVHARASLQLENVLILRERPDACKDRIRVPNQRLRTSLQDFSQAIPGFESVAYIRTQRCVACLLDTQQLDLLPLRGVPNETRESVATILDDLSE